MHKLTTQAHSPGKETKSLPTCRTHHRKRSNQQLAKDSPQAKLQCSPIPLRTLERLDQALAVSAMWIPRTIIAKSIHWRKAGSNLVEALASHRTLLIWLSSHSNLERKKVQSTLMSNVCKSKPRNSWTPTNLNRQNNLSRERCESMSMTMLYCISSAALPMLILVTCWLQSRCLLKASS